MTTRRLRTSASLPVAAVVILVVALAASAQEAVPMLTNYQGEIKDPVTGDPVPDGTYDMRFRIYDVQTGGTHLWEENHSSAYGNPVEVANGIFSVLLGSGTGDVLNAFIFSGPNRWLEIRVGTETMSPRQRLTSVAYSMISEDSRLLDGNAASAFAEAVHLHSGSDITSGTIAEGRIDAMIARDTEVDSKIASHAGISSAHHPKTTSFTELTDTAADAQIPPTIARDSEVSSKIAAHEAVVDAHHPRYSDTEAVAAMGAKSDTNPLNHDKTASFSELTGTLSEAQVPPTIARTAQIMPTVLASDGPGSTLNADVLDGVDSSGFAAVGHTHTGEFWELGGNSGTSPGTDFLGTTDNQAVELRVNNTRALRLEPASSPNLIGGHGANTADEGVVGASIGGGGGSGLGNRVTDNFGTVGGGLNNQAGDAAGTTSDSSWATVGGGAGNLADGDYATVGAGQQNTASGGWASVGGGSENTALGQYSTVGGGAMNRAKGDYSTIAGGGPSDPSDAATRNRVTDNYCTVGGGGNNQAGDAAGTTDDAAYATVGGGASNTAGKEYATVGGGYLNSASAYATVAGGRDNTAGKQYATVGGGMSNNASGDTSTIGGGVWNTASEFCATVGGGYINEASADSATVGGGYENTAGGFAATVPGGYANEALGQHSFAAGRRAKANHRGSFVWGDSQDEDISSLQEDEVKFRCLNGVEFTSGGSGTDQSIFWVPGYSNWASISDRNLKENFVEIDSKEVLERVSRLPITEWNFKGYALRHIGPMAQDFHALFPLGGSHTTIDSGDLQGVSLAAIQGLYKLVQEKDARISSLEERIEVLETLVARLIESQAGGGE
jgi:hypothetical protein